MSLETATFISQLNPANPVVSDPIAQGDDHLRLLKSVLQAQFSNLGTAAVSATAAQINQAASALAPPVFTIPSSGTVSASEILQGGTGSANVTISNVAGGLVVQSGTTTILTVDPSGNLTTPASLNSPSVKKSGNELLPVGCVLLWSGAIGSIPAGWALCDGTAGTPDLRGLFIVGAGGTYSQGQTSGSSMTGSTSAAGDHAHGGAAGQAGAHSHSATMDQQGGHDHGGATGGHTLDITEIPIHNHSVQLVSNGGGPPGTGEFTSIAGAPTTAGQTDYSGGGLPHTHSISSTGNHVHNITVAAVSDHAHSIATSGTHTHTVSVTGTPAYYALAFIKKL